MKVEKRSRFQIYFDLLQIFCVKTEDSELLPTRVAHRANLPYDRFQSYLERLIQLGMVCKGSSGEPVVTEKGLEFIQEYKRMTTFLKRMGLFP